MSLRLEYGRVGNRAGELLPYLFFLATWHIAAVAVQYFKGAPFPTPSATFSRAVELLAGEYFLHHSLYQHLFASLTRWAIGFALAAAVGLAAGIITTISQRADRLIMPITAFLQPIPSLAWIPLAVLLLGLGNQSTIFIIFLAGVFPIMISVSAGIHSIPKGLIRAAQMMGADKSQIFFRVLLPGALPHLLTGLRAGLANGWRALIAAEMVGGTDLGLGYAIFQARWSLDYSSAFVAMILIALIGLLIEGGIFRKVEAKTVKIWGMSNQGGGQC
ncbi:MAG: ABC transporter permease [Firmicutes bacterium]|nr:ABC transporter permease [Bacillota bacterium]